MSERGWRFGRMPVAAVATAAVVTLVLVAGSTASSTATFPRHWPNSPRHHPINTRAPRATPSLSMNVRGGLASAGNTLLTCPGNVGSRRRLRAVETCPDANNNDQNMVYVNVAPLGHFNSSTATL